MTFRRTLSFWALVWTTTVSGVAFAQTAPSTAQYPPAAPPAAQPQPAPAGQQPQPAPAPAPAAQPYTPPPGYQLVPIQQPPPVYPAPAPAPRPAPAADLPYTEGQTIPPGYHVEERKRKGLIVAGAVVTGVFWTFSVTGAVAADYEDNSGFLLIPVLGPWLMLATGGANDPPCDDVGGGLEVCESNAPLRAILVLDGLAQTAGGLMFVLGMANPSKRLVRDDVTVGVVPMKVGRTGQGLGVVGTF